VELAFTALVIAVVVIIVSMLGFVRVVRPHERMVVFRLGRTDESLVRGPGRTFLLPILDHPVIVDMREQRFQLDHLPATTRDGDAIEADIEVRCRVVDPYKHVVNVAIFPANLRGVAAMQVQAAAATLTLDEALHGTVIDQAVRPVIETVTNRWGVVCSSVEVRRLESIEAAPAAPSATSGG
jgi:regulator of protease activity HflC (stomatin/prohibitin superfamily)